MAGLAFVGDLNNFIGRIGAGGDHGAERCQVKMGLITQRNDQVGEGGIGQPGGGDDRAHHAPLGSQRRCTLTRRDSEPIQFRDHGRLRIARMNHDDILYSRFHPLVDEMAEHGCILPRKA